MLRVQIVECQEHIHTNEFVYQGINCRKHIVSLSKFGAKGDGKTSNTVAFRSAIAELSESASDGGAMLVVPPGKWLTGSFNLTSSFTLYLQKGAVILGSQVHYYLSLCHANDGHVKVLFRGFQNIWSNFVT